MSETDEGYYAVNSGYEDPHGNWRKVQIVVATEERDSGNLAAVVVTQKHSYHSND